jgi:hypothetical protein
MTNQKFDVEESGSQAISSHASMSSPLTTCFGYSIRWKTASGFNGHIVHTAGPRYTPCGRVLGL